jgi:hypothetical protein
MTLETCRPAFDTRGERGGGEHLRRGGIVTVKILPSPRPSPPGGWRGDLFSCAGVNGHIEAVHERLEVWTAEEAATR